MNSKAIGADITMAWPDAQIGAMDGKLAAKIMYDGQGADVINEKAAEYEALTLNVTSAAKRGYVDQIVNAADTRKYVIGAFEMLFTKSEDRPAKKHGNCIRKGDYKMKKFLSLVCMITCIFGLTACGSEETYTDYEQRKMDTAIQIATQYVIPSLENFEDEATLESFSEYTADEVAYMVQENVGITVDGYAYKTAIESFNSAKKTIGGITAVGDADATIDDDQIIVHVDVTGANQNAQAEVIFSNDMFLSMESAALNPVESMGGLMTKAALNTLIGMGTVFVMLIINLADQFPCSTSFPGSRLHSAKRARRKRQRTQVLIMQ